MKCKWSCTPNAELWTRVLVVFAFTSAIVAAGMSGYVWSRRGSLPRGYLAGMVYGAIAYSWVITFLRLKSGLGRPTLERKVFSHASSPTATKTPADPAPSEHWFAWLVFAIFMLLIVNELYPIFTTFSSLFLKVFNFDPDLPWWHPHKAFYLTTCLLGLLSVASYILIRFIERRGKAAKAWASDSGNEWWKRDARVPGIILFALVMTFAGLIWFVDRVWHVNRIEMNQMGNPPLDDNGRTMIGGFSLLYSILTAHLTIWLLSVTDHKLRSDLSNLKDTLRPPTVGVWDHDLDHDFATPSRPLS